MKELKLRLMLWLRSLNKHSEEPKKGDRCVTYQEHSNRRRACDKPYINKVMNVYENEYGKKFIEVKFDEDWVIRTYTEKNYYKHFVKLKGWNA
jgi:hypothetical protein